MLKKRPATEKLPVPPASGGRIARIAGLDDSEREAKANAPVATLKAKKAGLKPHDKPLEGKAAIEATKTAGEKVAAVKEARQAIKLAKKPRKTLAKRSRSRA